MPNSIELDRRKQKLIWDLEHITFELEWKFGAVFKEALMHRDRASLANCFRDGFVGRLPLGKSDDPIAGDWWQQVGRKIDNSKSSERASASAVDVADYLIGYLADFDEIGGLKLRVLEISEQLAAGEAMAYKLKLYLTASGRSKLGGPCSHESTHIAMGRFSNDGEIASAQILTSWEVESESIRSASRIFMEEITAQSRLDQVELRDNWRTGLFDMRAGTLAMQVASADFDQDGYLDVAVSTMYGVQYLLRLVDGSHFEVVTEQFGLPPFRPKPSKGLASWIDFDNDGYPDILFGDSLYRNEGGQRFKDITKASGLRFDSPTLGCIVGDYDCDGLLDVYVLHDAGGGKTTVGFVGDETSAGARNRLWRNLGNGRFEDVTDIAGVAGDKRHSYSAAWLFANDDHYPDLYVVNDFGKNLLYVNDGDGHFTDITDKAKVGDFANSMGVAVGDINGDGDVEIYVANMFSKMGKRIVGQVCKEDYPTGVYEAIRGACTGNHMYRLSSDRVAYDEVSLDLGVNQVGWAFAPAFVDLDADGFLDIYATTGFISKNRGKPDG